MLESKAKGLICPFMTNTVGFHSPDSGTYGGTIETECIGSQCMAWEFDAISENQSGILPPKPIGTSTTNGYCRRL